MCLQQPPCTAVENFRAVGMSHLEAELAQACQAGQALYLRYAVATKPQLLKLHQGLQILYHLYSGF